MLAEGITLPEQVALTGHRFCDPPHQVDLLRTGPAQSGLRACGCTAATQPSAELAAGLTWAAVGTGQATATINKHVLVYHRTPILWTRARAAHSPLGGLGGRPATGPDPPVAKAGPSLGLLLRCGCGQQLGYAERADRSDLPWPVASFARATGCHLSPVAPCTCRSPVAAARPDRARLASR